MTAANQETILELRDVKNISRSAQAFFKEKLVM